MTHIPDEDWKTVVESMPVPTVDLVVKNEDDEFLLGKRQYKPAKDLWFVPGGRIHKDESVYNAVHRKAREELGLSVQIVDDLGWYEHFYDTSDVGDDISKHYTALGFVVTPKQNGPKVCDQHEELRWFTEAPKATHEYTQVYLQDAGLL